MTNASVAVPFLASCRPERWHVFPSPATLSGPSRDCPSQLLDCRTIGLAVHTLTLSSNGMFMIALTTCPENIAAAFQRFAIHNHDTMTLTLTSCPRPPDIYSGVNHRRHLNTRIYVS